MSARPTSPLLPFINAQEMRQLHPATFGTPTATELAAIALGDSVKVCTGGERFWVTVAEATESTLTGTVDNELVCSDAHGLRYGDTISFPRECVYDIIPVTRMGTSTTTPQKQLPADPDVMNDDRADWAAAAIDAFIDATGADREDALSDLLSDLMHLCDRVDDLGNFKEQLERARGHYEAETASGLSWEAYQAYLNDPASRPEGMSDQDWNSYCPSFDEWKRGKWHPPAATIAIGTEEEAV